MPFLLTTGERYELPTGTRWLGGDGEDAIAVPGLEDYRRGAAITVTPDGVATIRRATPSADVRVNGISLGARPLPLTNGVRITYAGIELTFAAGERRHSREATAENGSAKGALATLRVTRGGDAGTTWTVDRPVCSIGRGAESDIRIAHESVSSAHASLLFKRGAWYVTDLRSANGTYVDGYRVAAERELPPGATLRVGKVEMTFSPVDATEDPANDTKAVSGVARRIKRPR